MFTLYTSAPTLNDIPRISAPMPRKWKYAWIRVSPVSYVAHDADLDIKYSVWRERDGWRMRYSAFGQTIMPRRTFATADAARRSCEM